MHRKKLAQASSRLSGRAVQITWTHFRWRVIVFLSITCTFLIGSKVKGFPGVVWMQWHPVGPINRLLKNGNQITFIFY